jgi:hypothetical protein
MAPKKPDVIPEEGDKVGWNWGAAHAEGEVEEVVPDDAQIQSKGKTITRKGTEDNPAVKVGRPEGGNPVIKKASELHVFDEGEEIPKNEKVPTGK